MILYLCSLDERYLIKKYNMTLDEFKEFIEKGDGVITFSVKLRKNDNEIKNIIKQRLLYLLVSGKIQIYFINNANNVTVIINNTILIDNDNNIFNSFLLYNNEPTIYKMILNVFLDLYKQKYVELYHIAVFFEHLSDYEDCKNKLNNKIKEHKNIIKKFKSFL